MLDRVPNGSHQAMTYLNFFEVMIETPKGIVKSSQRKVVSALTDPTFKTIMITESPRDSQGESRLDVEPEDFDGDGDVDADDQILRYYLRLVALLEACCCDMNTLATGIVQKNMQANNIFDEIRKAGAVGDLPRKTIFARLLYSAYLCVFVPTANYYDDDDDDYLSLYHY